MSTTHFIILRAICIYLCFSVIVMLLLSIFYFLNTSFLSYLFLILLFLLRITKKKKKKTCLPQFEYFVFLLLFHIELHSCFYISRTNHKFNINSHTLYSQNDSCHSSFFHFHLVCSSKCLYLIPDKIHSSQRPIHF